jgi:hypothetical protein
LFQDSRLCEVNEVEPWVLISTCKAFGVGREDLLEIMRLVECDDGENGQS